MSQISKATPSQVPNQLVIETADAYAAAFRTLTDNGATTLLPALHCAFIALELYLKSLSSKEVDVPVPDGMSHIHAKTAAQSHRLEKLLDLAPKPFQDALDAQIASSSRLRSHGSASAALAAHNPMFMGSRYPFEAGQVVDGIEMYSLAELVSAVSTSIRSIEPMMA